MAYTTIDNPFKNFNTVTFTGNGSTQSITGVGFQPDWVWIKNRGAVTNHEVADSVRGANKLIKPNDTDAEQNNSNKITSFDSDGFGVGNDANVNQNSTAIVSWNWLADGSTSSNGDGSITSTVSVNTTAGFSIVSYTGTGANATIGHGLGAVPKWIITKDRDNSNAWYVYHVGIGNTHGLRLSTTDAKEDDATLWNDTTPTSSVFSVGSNTGTNRSANPIIAYCFAEVKGYSRFGSYSGNGSTDGTFVYTGFKPALIITKKSSASGTGWVMIDNKRETTNDGSTNYVLANAATAETDSSFAVDFLSNGFKPRTNSGGTNTSGETYVYVAFAEAPFVTSGTKAAGTAR
jgi:hypothetical protein|tara:strand:+ start:519 stop:1559 length:1041 start_codon:yes stop_codon:yes gene_type:complete